MQTHGKNRYVPFPRPCGATGKNAQKLHAPAFVHFCGAVLVALEALKQNGNEVHIYSDSSYVVKAVEEGWLKKWLVKGLHKQKNPDLWDRYIKAAARQNVRFHWIKGHAGHPENELCDRLAVTAALDTNNLLDDSFAEEEK